MPRRNQHNELVPVEKIPKWPICVLLDPFQRNKWFMMINEEPGIDRAYKTTCIFLIKNPPT